MVRWDGTYLQCLFKEDHVDALVLGAKGWIHDDGVHLVRKLRGQQLRHIAPHKLHLILELKLDGILLGHLERIVVDVQPDREPAPNTQPRQRTRRGVNGRTGSSCGDGASRTRCP
jgi:hypothetical protein